MQLELGSGYSKREGWTTLDIDPATCPDILADCCSIPLPDNSVTALRAINILEHIEWSKVRSCLKEWGRICSPAATLEIHVPDVAFLPRLLTMTQWQDGSLQPFNASSCRWEYLNHWIMSTCSPYNMHRSVFTFDTLAALLAEAGFTNCSRLPSDERWLYITCYRTK